MHVRMCAGWRDPADMSGQSRPSPACRLDCMSATAHLLRAPVVKARAKGGGMPNAKHSAHVFGLGQQFASGGITELEQV